MKAKTTGPDRHAVIPDGAFTYPIAAPKPTHWFGFLLLPEFTLLAFSSAIDPLRIANQVAQKPLYGWHVVSQDGAPVASSSGLTMGVHGGLEDMPDNVHLFVCSGTRGMLAASDKTVADLRRRARFGATLGGICTGAATLARAGLLTGKRFTMHWENQPGFVEHFPDLAPSENRIEEDGTLLTCGGGSAAAEMMLSRIAADYGQDFAILVADMCLNDPDLSGRRTQRSSIATAVASRNPKLVRIVQAMYRNIEDPLPLEELARHVSISRRQIERLFDKNLGESPAAIYRNIRLERARALLVETDKSLLDIAMETGFNSTALFSRHFKARYGQTPTGIKAEMKAR